MSCLERAGCGGGGSGGSREEKRSAGRDIPMAKESRTLSDNHMTSIFIFILQLHYQIL